MVIKSPIHFGGTVGGGSGSDEDAANVMDYGAIGDGTANDTAAFTAAIASGKRRIIVPWTANGYRINTSIQIHSINNVTLEGVGGTKPVIRSFSSGSDHLLSLYSENSIFIKNLKFTMTDGSGTGSAVVINDVDYVVMEDCDIEYGKAHNISVIGGSNRLLFNRCVIKNSANDGLWLDGATNVKIIDCEASSNGNFGVYCLNSADNIEAVRLYGTSNDLELFISNWDSTNISALDCHAVSCGDNGLSLGGNGLRAIGNRCFLNQNNGIAVYGQNFTVTGNICKNNNKSGAAFSGIVISPAWGGIGSYGAINGNTCYDDQAVPTQKYGIELQASQYTAWSNGGTVAAAYPYATNANKLYRASAITVDTAAGSTPPTHTSGTVSDGVIAWTYLNTTTTSFNATGVAYGANECWGNVTANHFSSADAGVNKVQMLGSFGVNVDPQSTFHVYRNTSQATSMMTLEEDGTGDCAIQFLLSGEIAHVIGQDNSDSNKFKISKANDGFGSSNLLAAIGTGGDLALNSTITAPGTTTTQTINKPAGRVNIAAAGTSCTVNNSLVTTSSIILAVPATNDSTATVKNVVPGNGSFVINTTACASETAFNFFVLS